MLGAGDAGMNKTDMAPLLSTYILVKTGTGQVITKCDGCGKQREGKQTGSECLGRPELFQEKEYG